MKNRFKNLIQQLKRLRSIKLVLEINNPEQLHVQQPVWPIDDIGRYGYYRASVCINPGKTALIYDSKYHEKIVQALKDQDKRQGIKNSIVLTDRSTQIIKN